jgi:hypothetical protein
METHGGMILTGKTDSPTRALSSHLVAKQEELGKEMVNFALQRISFMLESVL